MCTADLLLLQRFETTGWLKAVLQQQLRLLLRWIARLEHREQQLRVVHDQLPTIARVGWSLRHGCQQSVAAVASIRSSLF